MNSYLLRCLELIATVVLLYLNIELWHLGWLSVIILVIFFWFEAPHYEAVLAERFDLSPGLRLKIISAFLLLSIFGFLAGIFVVFWHLGNVALVFSLFISGLIGALIAPIDKVANAPSTVIGDSDDGAILIDKKSYLAVFAIFAVLGFVTLWYYSTNSSVVTPWQIVPTYFVYLFFFLLLVSGSCIFSKFKLPIIFSLLVAQFFLAYSFLPLSHDLFWGADGWRHKATIDTISAGETIRVENFSENNTWISRLNPGVFSYSQFWAVIASLVKMTNISSELFISWLQPVCAAFLIPFLFFEIGLAFGWSRRSSLFFAWSGLLPFALQMAGAFTLPVGFGFLTFLIFFLLLIKRSANKNKSQLPLFVGLMALSVFGYALYAILMFASFIALEFMSAVKIQNEKFKMLLAVIATAVIFAIIPAIEFTAGYARFDSEINFVNSMKQAGGNFLGIYLASGPRPHLIETGNIFFNQIPSYAFIPNAFTSWRVWIVIFMAIFFSLAIIGANKLLKQGIGERITASLGIGLFFGYILTRYFFAGEHILSRRLDAVIAFFALLFVISIVKKTFEKNSIIAMFAVLITAIATTASFSLGPYSRAMGEDEYRAAIFVWSELKSQNNYCVIADTYPLLALEAVSQKKIIGGNFPINENFSQPELNLIYRELSASSTPSAWQRAKELTSSDFCYLIMQVSKDRADVPLIKFGDQAVYRY